MAEKKSNPFDLGERGGPARPHVARDWTEAEIAEKLAGYLEIPPELWEQVRYGEHVRYFTKKDGFRPGGFVLKNPYDMRPKDAPAEKRFIRLHNSIYVNKPPSPGYSAWPVAYEDIEKLYVKPNAAISVVMLNQEAVTKKLNENIRKLVDHLKKLDARIAALEKA